MGFSNVKGITLSTLQLVEVHGCESSMGGDESDISAGAGEGVGGMVNRTGLTSGSIPRLGGCRGGSSVGAEMCIENELVEVEEFSEGDRGGFGKKVLG